MSTEPPSPSPFAPPSVPPLGAPPLGGPSLSGPVGPPPSGPGRGPTPGAVASAYGAAPLGTAPLGTMATAPTLLGPPTLVTPPPVDGPPQAPPALPPDPGSGPFFPPTSAPTPPEPEPKRRRGQSWGAGIALGAVIGAVVAALVAGSIYVASVKTRTDGLAEAGSGASASAGTGNSSRPPVTLAGKPLDIGALLDKVRPSVVSVKIEGISGEAAGSGVVIDDKGTVLTNAHVIAPAAGAGTINIGFHDGEVAPATLVGSFPSRDVALIRATTTTKTTPAELGTSDSLQVGDDVIAIGNALNLGAQPSVTKGIVSALDRSLEAQGEQLDHLIQTDAAINPGNSGGPLVNALGQVVGINTAIIQNSQNVGFALSIDSIKSLIADIEAGKGDVDGNSPFLGVVTTDVADQSADIVARFRISVREGAFISEVQPGSAAAAAGLQPGDVITAINGRQIQTNEDVGAAFDDKQPGDTITIEIQRLGREQTLEATLGRRGG